MLTTRQIEILKCLESRRNYMTTTELAEEFSISSRTIRNDLDMIEYSLRELPIYLERTPRLGIRLTRQGEIDLDTILYSNGMKIYSKKERTIVIMLLLILTDKTTIEQLAEQLKVSKNTLVEDLKSVEKMLDFYGIKLIRKSYYGLSIKGDEEEIRNAVFHCYIKATKEKTVNLDEVIKKHSVIDWKIPQKIICAAEEGENIRYSDDSTKELENMILVSLCRSYYGFHIEYETMPDMMRQEDYQRITSLLDQYVGFPVTQGDILYIHMLFDVSKKITGEILDDSMEDKKIMALTEKLIREFCKITKIDYEVNTELSYQIMIHLKVAIYRIRNKIPIENPLEEDIRYSSLFMYDITRKILKDYERLFGVVFPEAEIAYTTMYFEALFQENHNLDFALKILLVCNGGTSTAVLLKQRLNLMLPELEVMKVCRMKDIKQEANEITPDFIISTIPVELEGYKIIQVNPLLEPKDIEVIRQTITEFSYNKKTEYLARQIECHNEIKIQELLQEEFCRFDADLKEWREAIASAARPLIDAGCVEEEYVEDMIKVVQTVGNYMVFIPEIAFVHAPPIHVNCNSMALLNLRQAIEFGTRNKVSVKVLIVLANKEENTNLLDLIQILSEKNNVNLLKQAKRYEDILKMR